MITQALTSIPVIDSTHELYQHQFDNRFVILCADPYNLVEPNQDKIERLAQDLKAVDATIVKKFEPSTIRRQGGVTFYLTAKKFGSLHTRLKEAFNNEKYHCSEVVDETTTHYRLQIPSKKFYCGYPLEFWGEDESGNREDYWGEIEFYKVESLSKVD